MQWAGVGTSTSKLNNRLILCGNDMSNLYAALRESLSKLSSDLERRPINIDAYNLG